MEKTIVLPSADSSIESSEVLGGFHFRKKSTVSRVTV
jgi:hypothetical protein